MAHYQATVTSPRPPTEVFDELAEFSNAARWDPGVVVGERTTEGPPGVGTSFRLLVSVLGRRVPLEYRVVAFEPPRRVVLQAENGSVRSTDEIEVVASGQGGCTVTYDANLQLRGPARLFSPMLAGAFRRIGDRAMVGLREALAS